MEETLATATLRIATVINYGGKRFGETDPAATTAAAELDETRGSLDAAAGVGG